MREAEVPCGDRFVADRRGARGRDRLHDAVHHCNLDHGQRTRRQHHEKRIPRCHHSTVADEPRVSRIRRNSHALAMWWRIGWPSALAGMVAIFVGSLVAGFIVPQASGGHLSAPDSAIDDRSVRGLSS